MLKTDAFVLNPDQKKMDFMFQKLDLFYLLHEKVKKEVFKKCFEFELKAGDYLLKKNDFCYHIYFILNGIVTGHATSRSQTITSFISVEGELVTAIQGIYGSSPASEDIKACEDVILLGLHVNDLAELAERFPEMNILMMKVMEHHYKMAHRRSIFFRMGTAADKYVDFLQTFPNHASRIPLNEVASFLSIKIDTLKKIVSSWARGDKYQPLSRQEIETYIKGEQPFLIKKLTLPELANRLNVSPHCLSNMLQVYFNQNFNNFINRHRVNFIINQLPDKENLKRYNIDNIGSEAGFSSRNTFFKEFKKQTGRTPHAYLQQLVEDNSVQ